MPTLVNYTTIHPEAQQKWEGSLILLSASLSLTELLSRTHGSLVRNCLSLSEPILLLHSHYYFCVCVCVEHLKLPSYVS